MVELCKGSGAFREELAVLCTTDMSSLGVCYGIYGIVTHLTLLKRNTPFHLRYVADINEEGAAREI